MVVLSTNCLLSLIRFRTHLWYFRILLGWCRNKTNLRSIREISFLKLRYGPSGLMLIQTGHRHLLIVLSWIRILELVVYGFVRCVDMQGSWVLFLLLNSIVGWEIDISRGYFDLGLRTFASCNNFRTIILLRYHTWLNLDMLSLIRLPQWDMISLINWLIGHMSSYFLKGLFSLRKSCWMSYIDLGRICMFVEFRIILMHIL